MPELPDITVYVEHLERRLLGRILRKVTLANPFVLRTVQPPLGDAAGRRVVEVRRLGKRIVLALDDERFLVIHLMIAGRLRWRDAGGKAPGKITLASFTFDDGVLYLTEAGSKRRASLHYVAGEAALAALDPGGLDVFALDAAQFAARLAQGNHTVKRALTDPRLFSGIGNSYSDEILHRARLSPFALGARLAPADAARLHEAVKHVLSDWTQRLREETGATFPEKSPRSTTAWPCTAATANPARTAARRCSASSTPTTKPTTARAARPTASCWPTARCRACCTTAGPRTSTSCSDASGGAPFGPATAAAAITRSLRDAAPARTSPATMVEHARTRQQPPARLHSTLIDRRKHLFRPA